ncbi:hypothetical protein EDM00_10290 [Ornithobacterium rhinotracheale]|uniref:hypothetical protein n=1 Tax=Ornithobacterium rhinotracheale TaxID=28251 RepID=UPI00129CB563|nr:hypothetical protein [Ornithobacterium rhinotracheale]MRI64371.1 hypothetical protein [Ornithobacterium rhinotracheale]
MNHAMEAVLDYPQKASTTHCEAWYGFYTSFLGGKIIQNPYLQPADQVFQQMKPMILDTIKWEPKKHKDRIQNASTKIGILVARYQLFHDEKDLNAAIKLANFLMTKQSADGAYRSGKTHYTSVIYIAKSLMELLAVLEPKTSQNPFFSEKYQAIYKSVQKAMDELVLNKTNIATEGELTLEDGMLSCSALQLAEFALLQTSEPERMKYQKAAEFFMNQHQCLEQNIIPDARMRGASLRFWEAQYDVLMDNNFLNSPHGWSSWTTYAYYYLYLLTGEFQYLEKTINLLNTSVQSIDSKTGKLRWGFMVNPYIKVVQINGNINNFKPMDFSGVHYHAQKYKNKIYIAGEQYIDMVGDWFGGNSNDNDVHEHFKCLAEIALDKCYVYYDGEKAFGYNCRVNSKRNILAINLMRRLSIKCI